MLAATAHSLEAPSLSLLPLPGPGRAEEEMNKSATTSQAAATTCREHSSDMAGVVPRNHAEFCLALAGPQIIWRACPLTAPPLLCTSYVGVGRVPRQPCPCCTSALVPPFTSFLSAADLSRVFCHAAPKIPSVHRLT